MKQILLITLFSFSFSSFMIASTDTFSDNMAVIGSPALSSEPCAAIDKKLIKLDAFTTMINNTSAFHLEEKASALPVPGITVSNNKKKMLRDAKKKYAEYTAERQKYGCETPMIVSTDKKDVVSKPALSSEPCAAIDKKLMKLDAFTTMVNNTSAFHLEEKAEALSVPGITVSNNKKKMLRDAKKKYAKYAAERQKYGCETPMIVSTDKKDVVSKPAFSSEPSAAIDNKPVKQDKVTTKVNNTSTVSVEEKSSAVLIPDITVSKHKQEMKKVEEKKVEVREVEHPKYVTKTSGPVTTAQTVEKKVVVNKPVLSTTSSDTCAAIDKKLIKLYEFSIMVNNTSAFHLEEKASALLVPGITMSNNKKKMLRDAEKKRVKLLEERQKYSCEPITTE